PLAVEVAVVVAVAVGGGPAEASQAQPAEGGRPQSLDDAASGAAGGQLLRETIESPSVHGESFLAMVRGGRDDGNSGDVWVNGLTGPPAAVPTTSARE